MEFSYFSEKHGTASAEAKELCREVDSIKQLIFGWVAQRKSCVVAPSYNKKNQKTVCIIFCKDGDDIGWTDVTVAKVRKFYPGIVPVDNAPRRDEYTKEEQWFRKRDSKLGLRFDLGVHSNLASKEAAIALALSYALSNVGEARFEEINQTRSELFLEPENRQRFSSQRVISLDLMFSDFSTSKDNGFRPGWGEWAYIIEAPGEEERLRNSEKSVLAA